MGGDDWNWLELAHGHIQRWVQVAVLLNGCCRVAVSTHLVVFSCTAVYRKAQEPDGMHPESTTCEAGGITVKVQQKC